MNQAQNIQILADGGYVGQAIQMCESQSVSVTFDENANEYEFSDGSCARVEDRLVTVIDFEKA